MNSPATFASMPDLVKTATVQTPKHGDNQSDAWKFPSPSETKTGKFRSPEPSSSTVPQSSSFKSESASPKFTSPQQSTSGLPKKVSCPVCSIPVTERYINLHLDRCLNGPPPQQTRQNPTPKRKKLPKLVYNLMNDKDVRKRLADVGLPTHGDKRTLVKRHQEFTLLYNTQCDSLNPKSTEEIVRDMQKSTTKLLFQLSTSKPTNTLTINKGATSEQIEKAQKNYAKQHKSQFDQLIAETRARMKRRKEELRAKKTESEEKQNENGDSKNSKSDTDENPSTSGSGNMTSNLDHGDKCDVGDVTSSEQCRDAQSPLIAGEISAVSEKLPRVGSFQSDSSSKDLFGEETVEGKPESSHINESRTVFENLETSHQDSGPACDTYKESGSSGQGDNSQPVSEASDNLAWLSQTAPLEDSQRTESYRSGASFRLFGESDEELALGDSGVATAETASCGDLKDTGQGEEEEDEEESQSLLTPQIRCVVLDNPNGSQKDEGAVLGYPDGLQKDEEAVLGYPDGSLKNEGAVSGNPNCSPKNDWAVLGNPDGLQKDEGTVLGLPENEGAVVSYPSGSPNYERAIRQGSSPRMHTHGDKDDKGGNAKMEYQCQLEDTFENGDRLQVVGRQGLNVFENQALLPCVDEKDERTAHTVGKCAEESSCETKCAGPPLALQIALDPESDCPAAPNTRRRSKRSMVKRNRQVEKEPSYAAAGSSRRTTRASTATSKASLDCDAMNVGNTGTCDVTHTEHTEGIEDIGIEEPKKRRSDRKKKGRRRETH